MTRPRRHGGDRLLKTDRLHEPDVVTADYLIAPVDRLRADMARKWGEDRLPELVTLDLAERFGRQVEKFERAVADRPLNLDAIRHEAPRMLNALRALDAAAEAAGAPKADPEAWEITVDGRPCAILRDGAHAAAYAASNPGRRVYTLEEVARILALDGLRLVNATKDAFPGATVSAVRPRPTPMSQMLDDQIPFAPETR